MLYEKYERFSDSKLQYLKRIYTMHRCDANPNHRNIEWGLSFEDWSNLVKQDCSICGSKPILKEGKVHKTTGTQIPINGVDRIDNDKGYVLENVRSCCSRCNFMKHKMDNNEFMEQIKKIWSHNFANL